MEPPLVIDESEDFDVSAKNVTDLLCQGCKKNKAFFMCAGCSRQWYCSKECQVSSVSPSTQEPSSYRLSIHRKWPGTNTPRTA
jgi:hypothetical protein